MMADCPKCKAEMSVAYAGEGNPLMCACDQCGAQFEVEEDADWNGDHYQDTSTPGAEKTGVKP